MIWSNNDWDRKICLIFKTTVKEMQKWGNNSEYRKGFTSRYL